MKSIDQDKLYTFLREMEFNRLLSSAISKYGGTNNPETEDIEKNLEKTSEIEKKNYQLIKNEKEIEDWMKQSEEIGEFAIDTETTSLDPHTAKLVGISISNRIGNACYIPLNHVSGNNLNEKKVLNILKNYL